MLVTCHAGKIGRGFGRGGNIEALNISGYHGLRAASQHLLGPPVYLPHEQA